MSADGDWEEMFLKVRTQLEKHECKKRGPTQVPAIKVVAKETNESISEWSLEDGAWDFDEGEDNESMKSVEFKSVECADCGEKFSLSG